MPVALLWLFRLSIVNPWTLIFSPGKRAIGRRTSFRDYVDIYYLLSRNITSITRIISECGQKYILEGEKIFSAKLFLQQLKYTEDIGDKKETETFIFDKKVNSNVIENYLKTAVNQYLQEKYTGGKINSETP